MKKIFRFLCVTLVLMLVCTNSMAAVMSMDAYLSSDDDMMTVDIKLDEIPEDIDSVSAITIRYTYDKDKLEYVSTSSADSNMSNALSNGGNIVWYDETMDVSKGVTDESLAKNGNVLFTLKFRKNEAATGRANVDFTFVQLSSPPPGFEIFDNIPTEGAVFDFDVYAAQPVIDFIDSLSEACYTDEFKKALDSVATEYARLTDVQKSLVTNYADYEALVAQYKAMDDAVNTVKAAIEAITVVELTDECKANIENAEALYAALDEALKPYADGEAIAKARADYDKLVNDAQKVAQTIEAIGAIGKIEYTIECITAIKMAEELYNALETEALKSKVTNYDVLLSARTQYDEITPEIREFNNMSGYGGNHMIVVLGVGTDKKVTLNGVLAQIAEIDDEVYHIFVGGEDADAELIEIRDSSDAEPLKRQIIGSISYNDAKRITATDASIVNAYVAKLDSRMFDNDPTVFIRADVNGDGKITTMDALMIAFLAMYDEINYKVNVSIYLGDCE